MKVIRRTLFVVLMVFLLIEAAPQATATIVEDDSANTAFNVNVQEYLSVSITTPTDWASGSMNTFLRNEVSLDVTSNNASGFTASMTTKTSETSLINTSKSTESLPRLSANTTRNNFPANYWGYSLNDTENGNTSSTYSAVASSSEAPITLLTSATANASHKSFYFGAKADATKASGTYLGTVVISVVSGVVDENNPITPVNPVTPGDEEIANYDSNNDITTYTYHSSGRNTTSTTTEISSGDNRSAYQNFTPPQGASYSTTSKLGASAAAATGLGIAAAIATASGFFFLAAARRNDDEDQS